jgi:hypothetical protein
MKRHYTEIGLHPPISPAFHGCLRASEPQTQYCDEDSTCHSCQRSVVSSMPCDNQWDDSGSVKEEKKQITRLTLPSFKTLVNMVDEIASEPTFKKRKLSNHVPMSCPSTIEEEPMYRSSESLISMKNNPIAYKIDACRTVVLHARDNSSCKKETEQLVSPATSAVPSISYPAPMQSQCLCIREAKNCCQSQCGQHYRHSEVPSCLNNDSYYREQCSTCPCELSPHFHCIDGRTPPHHIHHYDEHCPSCHNRSSRIEHTKSCLYEAKLTHSRPDNYHLERTPSYYESHHGSSENIMTKYAQPNVPSQSLSYFHSSMDSKSSITGVMEPQGFESIEPCSNSFDNSVLSNMQCCNLKENQASSSNNSISSSDKDLSSVDNCNYLQLLPIRVLAHKIGLSKNSEKGWRYRDVKRSLFEKLSQKHFEFIEHNFEHALLKQRLPHKLSLLSFSKRIMLLVYHFIIRDGREPKFWRKGSVKSELVEKILRENDSEFYRKINRKAAFEVYSYMVNGIAIEKAIEIQQQKNKLHAI